MEHIRKDFTATVVLTIICLILVGCSRSKNTANARVSDGKILPNYSNSTYKNEPDGFRGIKWGTDISTLTYLKATKNDAGKFPGMDAFQKAEDELSIGDVKLKSVTYYFWKGKFAGVRIVVDRFRPSGNLNKLSEILVGKFGTPAVGSQPDLMPGNPPVYWQGKTTTITLGQHPVLVWCYLWFESPQIIKEYTEERNKIAAQKVEEERLKREKKAREAKGF